MGRWVVAVFVCFFLGFAAPSALAEELAEKQLGGADLAVSIESSPPVAQPGQPLTYRVTVRNAGPGEAVLPVLTVRIPRQVEIMSVDVAECLPGARVNEIVCRSPRDVPARGGGGVVITGLVKPNARGPLRAEATLSSEVVDGNESDNKAGALTKVGKGADLAVRLAPSPAAQPGERFAVDAVVRNRGPRVVRDAVVYFESGRARFLTGSGAQCEARERMVGCTLPPIKSGTKARLQLAFRAPARPMRVTVRSPGLGDRNPANNRARLQIPAAQT